jgi:uncharacterized protein YrzB (UPF0473 family)
MNNNDDKLNIDDLDIFNGQEPVSDVITLTEEDGSQTDYCVMDAIDVDNVRYMLLVRNDDVDSDEPEAYLFKETNEDDNDCYFEPVENEEEYNKVILLLQDEDAEYEMKF